MATVIDLCSDSDSDSDNGPTVVSKPSASGRPAPAAASTASTTSTASTASTTLTTTTAPTKLAPIFTRPSLFKRKAPTPTPAVKTKTEIEQKPKDSKQQQRGIKQQPRETKQLPKETKQQPRETKPREKTRPLLKSEPAAPPPACGSEAIVASLNNAQRRAVTSACNTVAILAGPGSGKTHTLTSRVAWLIDVMGYVPANIIVATFTVKAAREMKERIGKVLGHGREKRIVLGTFHSVALRYLSAYGPRIGLQRGFSIVDDGDSRAIVKRVIKRLNYDTDPGVARAWISKKKAKGCLGMTASAAAEREAEAEIQRSNRPRPMRSVQQAAGVAGATAAESASEREMTAKLEAIHDAYQQHLASLNLLDYDDLLVRCTELLRAHPVCVSNVQAVLIDEYQDTNGIQFELMKLFAQARNRITVVGDPDQSIYGWRSAEITNLGRFLCDFSDTAEVSLEENYRSSRSILETSLQVIKQDTGRYEKSLLSLHKKGSMPVLRRLLDSKAEARWIVHEIKRVVQLTGGMVDHGDVAILVRSATLSRPIEQALARAAIPYRMIGGRKFFERAEIKLLVDYLRVISQPSNNEVLSRVINNPKRGVGAATIAGLLEEAETGDTCLWDLVRQHCRGDKKATTAINGPTDKKLSIFVGFMVTLRRRLGGSDEERDAAIEELGAGPVDVDVDGEGDGDGVEVGVGAGRPAAHTTNTAESTPFHVEPAKPYDLVELIVALIERLNYRVHIGTTFGGDDEARWANVEEFINMAREFMANAKQLFAEDQLPEIDGVPQHNQTNVLAKFLSNITLSADADKKDQETTPMVTISTIHAAKGLEWPVVFVPAAYDGSLPHKRSEDTNEERRLLYVAMTRAKSLLNISYGLYYAYNAADDKDKDRDPTERALSPFLEPIWSVWFAEKGPSYDRALLDEIGDILRRPVPSDKQIYATLPADAAIEDNEFPVDPDDAKRRANDNARGGELMGNGGRARGDRYTGPQSNQRRQMSSGPTYNLQGGGGIGSEGAWQRGYATTMEGAASDSTMGGQYGGFVTAAQHQKTVVEEPVQRVGMPGVVAGKTTGKTAGRTTKAAGQQTIMQTFMRSASATTSATVDNEPDLPAQRPPTVQFQRTAGMFSQRHDDRPAAPVPRIPAELTGRSLGGVRGSMMSIAGRQPRTSSTDTVDGKAYAQFSSSPTRPERPQPAADVPPQAEPRPLQAQLPTAPRPFAYNRPRPYTNKVPLRRPAGGKENENQITGTGRPAASLHNTTCAQLTSGSKRPADRMAGGITSIERLRQPFRPPSMKRPQG